jgi:hypothetical protein
MTGGAGNNQFIFSATGAHTITDFKASIGNALAFRDIGFNLGVGEGLGGSALKHLDAGVFVANSTGRFTNTTTGMLFYDPDGSGTGFSKSALAALIDHASLSAGSVGNVFFVA